MNALLIMCHKNAEQVVRFASKCQTANTDIFIHCDSQMPEAEFEMIKGFVMRGGYLTSRRYHGELDTRSLVDISMEMINTAEEIQITENKHYDYFLLCSGQDYLIKPMSYVEEQLQQSYPKPYIDCTPYAQKNWVWYKFHYNVAVCRMDNWIVKNMKKGVSRKAMRFLTLLLRKVTILLHMVPYDKCNQLGIDLYGGSAWWILPDKVIDFIYECYNGEDKIINLLLNETYTPEETFFQIMTMRSTLADMVEVNVPEMVAQNCKTWAYFSDEDKPFKGHPYIFTEVEFDKIKKSASWFARKFDQAVDTRVLDRIDAEILRVN